MFGFSCWRHCPRKWHIYARLILQVGFGRGGGMHEDGVDVVGEAGAQVNGGGGGRDGIR